MPNVFSQVTGDSIYNLLHLGEVETDKNDRPEVTGGLRVSYL